jgi:hypothetical protein
MRAGFFYQHEDEDASDNGVTRSQGTDDLWRIYEGINEWIRAADAKAGVILATSGVIATVVATLATTRYSSMVNPTLPNVLLWLGMAGIFLASFFSSSCIVPRLKPKCPASLLFFGDIANCFQTAEDYAKAYLESESDDPRLRSDLYNQVWMNSVIAKCKFLAVTKATYSLVFAVLFLLISGLVSHLIRNV